MFDWDPTYTDYEKEYFPYVLTAWNGKRRQVLGRYHTRQEAVDDRGGFCRTRPEFSDYKITKD